MDEEVTSEITASERASKVVKASGTQVVGVGDTTGASFDDSGDPKEEVGQ